MAVIIDAPLGAGMELIVDETKGILTVELKGSILGQAEDLKVPISLMDIFVAMEAKITNPFQRWALGLLIQLL